MNFTQSILLTIKKMLGISEEYHAFDIDILTNINAVFLTLNQLGVGPTMPYHITGEDETWQDFLGDQNDILAGIQTYVYQRVRLMFDPPTNSFLVDSMRKQIEEFEWRFNVQVEQPPVEEEDLEADIFQATPDEFTPQVFSMRSASRATTKESMMKDIFR